MNDDSRKVGRLPLASASGPQIKAPVSMPTNTADVRREASEDVRDQCCVNVGERKERRVTSIESVMNVKPHARTSRRGGGEYDIRMVETPAEKGNDALRLLARDAARGGELKEKKKHGK